MIALALALPARGSENALPCGAHARHTTRARWASRSASQHTAAINRAQPSDVAGQLVHQKVRKLPTLMPVVHDALGERRPRELLLARQNRLLLDEALDLLLVLDDLGLEDGVRHEQLQ